MCDITSVEQQATQNSVHVMHLVHSLGTGGMENGVVNISRGLQPCGIVSSIAALEPGGELEERIQGSGISIVDIPQKFGNDPTVAIRLSRELRRRGVSILHSHNWGTLCEGYLAARLAGIPLIHGEHGRVRTKLRQKIAQRWIWRRVKRLCSVSSALADRLAEDVGVSRCRIKVIPNGVDTLRFRPLNQRDLPKAREEAQLPTNAILFGMLARFVDFKNHRGVIEAFARMRKVNENAHLIFAGNGPLEAELRRRVDELRLVPFVHFLGNVNRPENLLPVLDVVISNSTHCEGMSNVILEAMACSIPVVATSVAASPELLDYGKAGVLVPAGDVSSLQTACEALIASKEQRMLLGTIGRQRILEHYSLEHMLKCYEELYRAVSEEEYAIQ